MVTLGVAVLLTRNGEKTYLCVRIFLLLKPAWEVTQLLDPIPAPSMKRAFHAALGPWKYGMWCYPRRKQNGATRGECEGRRTCDVCQNTPYTPISQIYDEKDKTQGAIHLQVYSRTSLLYIPTALTRKMTALSPRCWDRHGVFFVYNSTNQTTHGKCKNPLVCSYTTPG